MYDVVIIGAGVVGAFIARSLAAYELEICIVEKEHDVAMGASKANSGIVHAGFDAKCGSMKARMNVRGAELMESAAKELGVKYRKNGALVIGFDEQDRKTIDELFERGRKNRVADLKILGKEELKRLEPNISDDAICALYAPTSAIVCPYELTIAAVGNAMDNDVQLKCGFEVTDIEKTKYGFAVKSGNAEIQTRNVINAAGLYADIIAGMVGDTSFFVHPRKGEYMLLDRECGATVSATVFRTPGKLGKGILVSPTADGNLLLGPTASDGDDRQNKETTAQALDEIAHGAGVCVKNIPMDKVITSFSGLRAVGSTGDFIINSPLCGFVNVAGIESPGLTSAPAIAEYVLNILRDQGLPLLPKKEHIRCRKPSHAFREMSIEEKNKVIKEKPEFGRVVCRCETVTEGEILEAIRTNPKPSDLDGVKRRCRAQMGRCQGGFCAPYITGLLARELGIPYEEVTKFGGKSFNVIGKTKEVE